MTAIQAARGHMPVLQFCTPAQLQVDTTYQRPTDAAQSRTLINHIAREWDWGLYQPLVVARRADGNLYVVDGQHRLEAARVRGDIPQLPCVITAAADARQWKPGWINNIVGIRICHRQHGERVTRLALESMSRGFADQILRFCGTLFSAIVPVIVEQGKGFSQSLLIEILSDTPGDAWLGKFREAASTRGIGPVLAGKQLLAEAYAEAAAE